MSNNNTYCQPEPIPGSDKCFCRVCDPGARYPFSCHSKRNCGTVGVKDNGPPRTNNSSIVIARLKARRAVCQACPDGMWKDNACPAIGPRPCSMAAKLRDEYKRCKHWSE